MKLGDKKIDKKMALTIGFYILIIVDVILISISVFFDIPDSTDIVISIFDFFVCIFLLFEWGYNLYRSPSKLKFLKNRKNLFIMISSIPFDVMILLLTPNMGILRFLSLLKILRIFILFDIFYEPVSNFIKKSNMDKIVAAVIITIIIFTGLFWIYGTTYNLFDYFYFVVVTLTTVGYGDVTPQTMPEKIISIILIFVGVLVFSTITAAISSYFTDRLIDSDDDHIEEKLDSIEKELELVHSENEELKKEITELKNLIKEK